MSQVIKAFMGVFMVLFLLAASTGVLGAFYQILHAQNTHAHMIDELENSDFARSIMEACFEIAEQEEYRLQLSLYSDVEEDVICTEASSLPLRTENFTMAEVILFYDVEIPFFSLVMEQQLFGYAR